LQVIDITINTHFESYLAQFFLDWQMFHTNFQSESKYTFYFQGPFFSRKSYLLWHSLMWKNMLQPDRPQMTMCSMRCARWIPKATNTHSEHIILIAFPLQQWLQERAPMLSYTHITCLGSPICVRFHIALYTYLHFVTLWPFPRPYIMHTFGSYRSFLPHFQFYSRQYSAVYCYSIILVCPVKMFYRPGRVPEERSVVSFLLIVVSVTQVWISNNDDNSFLVMFHGTVRDTDPRYVYYSADLDSRIRCNTVQVRHE